MTVLVETMHRITVPNYEIRIWRAERPDYKFEPEPFGKLALLAQRNQELALDELARLLLAEDNVSAVEVLNWAHCGVVLYKEWP